MKLINSSVEWWQQDNLARHIARVGRICYKAKGKQPDEGLTDEEKEAFIQKRDEDRCKGFLGKRTPFNVSTRHHVFLHAQRKGFSQLYLGIPKRLALYRLCNQKPQGVDKRKHAVPA